MKISESAVAMSGKRHYSLFQQTQVSAVTMSASKWNELQEALGDNSAEVSISKESQSLLEQLKKEERQAQKDRGEQFALANMLHKSSEVQPEVPQVVPEEDHMIKTLRRILEMLKAIRNGDGLSYLGKLRSMKVEDIMEEDQHFGASVKRGGKTFGLSQNVNVIDLRSASATSLSSAIVTNSGATAANGATAWVRHVEKSGFMMEQESVSFSATGIVKTADGREINFGVDLEMSRGFAGSFFESSTEDVVLTDPLVINLDAGTASVSDQKFFFDLDADGKKEEISSLGQGSGFLAFDKNGDGTINDGSELFGTKSGDGFADLAKYDEDGNGWIDENDRIFNDLKVWTKDSEGKDKLMDLKSADVGAIYLGSANTQFHLNDASNKTNGVIQKTGVFLKESGSVGTVQHLDLAV
ncbi:MAG: hypothetical protein IJP29_05300 [Lachnospiraceae bacterium]|nr:hypothetical protein [Lachnospiraceae bacterium]